MESKILSFDEQLIDEIYQREFLYNKKSRLYRNQNYRENAWTEISIELDESADICKTKWKSIRDRFCRESKKIGSEENEGPRWELFDKLRFLDEHITARCSDTENTFDFEEKLIAEISRREFLYNKKLKLFSNITEREKAWYNICMKLKKTKKVCMSRWKSIQNQFSEELNKIQSGVIEQSDWELFDKLGFLENHVRTESPNSNEVIWAIEMDESNFEENLIEEISKREFLYSKKNPLYRNYIYKEIAWNEISIKLNESEKTCKDKWMSLRERFRTELYRNENGTDEQPQWKLFNKLRFLDEHITSPSISTNLASTKAKSTDNLSKDNVKSTIKLEIDPLLICTQPSTEELPYYEPNDFLSNLIDEAMPSESSISSKNANNTNKSRNKRMKRKISNANNNSNNIKSIEQSVQSFVDKIESLVDKKCKMNDNPDEAYYSHLANQLNKLPERDRENTKMEILQLVHSKLNDIMM